MEFPVTEMGKMIEETDSARHEVMLIKNPVQDVLNLRYLLVELLFRQLDIHVCSSWESFELEFESHPHTDI